MESHKTKQNVFRIEKILRKKRPTVKQNVCNFAGYIYLLSGTEVKRTSEILVRLCEMLAVLGIIRMGGGWVNQAYSRLSTTHGHITDCKLDSVVYAGVCV